MSFSQDISFVRNFEIAHQEIEGNTLLLNPKKLGVHELNETATFLWKQLATSHNITSLTELMCDEYCVEKEKAQNDISKILQIFLEQGLLK